MEQIDILTLPQTPIANQNVNKFIPPKFCQMLAYGLDSRFTPTINVLDSFHDRNNNLPEYINSLDRYNIEYGSLWIDSENIDLLLDNVNKLIVDGYISEISTDVYHCDCGIVEIEADKIQTCNPNNTNFYFQDGQMYSKCCHKKCHKFLEKILIFTPKQVKKESLNFFPSYLTKDANSYEKTVLNSYITISKSRKTGIEITYNGTKYNLDIDFLWGTYLASFSNNPKIVVSGNKVLYQLFVAGLLEKCLKPDSRTILLGLPIIEGFDKEFNVDSNQIILNLALYFSISWNIKTTKINTAIVKYLRNMSEEKRNELYDIIKQRYDYKGKIEDNIEEILKSKTNAQKQIRILKERRKI